MLIIFRKIRRTLMQKNKVTTYLLYAFGEIILVVIGILIALEINNKNDAKKEKDYEEKILIEIYNGLRADSARTADWIRPRIIEKEQGLKEMAALIDEGKYPGDSTFMPVYYRMDNRMKVSINFGPYETLKASGLDKVRSEEVRFWLVDLFESLLPRQIGFIENTEQNETDFTLSIKRELFIPKLAYGQDDEPFSYIVPYSAQIIKDERLMELFRSEENMAEDLNRRTNVIMESIELTLNMLRNYFDDSGLDYPLGYVEGMTGVRGRMSDADALSRGSNSYQNK